MVFGWFRRERRRPSQEPVAEAAGGQYRVQRCPLNGPGPFYTTGQCLACEAPEAEAPELLAPLCDANHTTYFVRQPETPEEVERACRAIQVCCVSDLRYGGTDRTIIERLRNRRRATTSFRTGGWSAATKRQPRGRARPQTPAAGRPFRPDGWPRPRHRWHWGFGTSAVKGPGRSARAPGPLQAPRHSGRAGGMRQGAAPTTRRLARGFRGPAGPLGPGVPEARGAAGADRKGRAEAHRRRRAVREGQGREAHGDRGQGHRGPAGHPRADRRRADPRRADRRLGRPDPDPLCRPKAAGQGPRVHRPRPGGGHPGLRPGRKDGGQVHPGAARAAGRREARRGRAHGADPSRGRPPSRGRDPGRAPRPARADRATARRPRRSGGSRNPGPRGRGHAGQGPRPACGQRLGRGRRADRAPWAPRGHVPSVRARPGPLALAAGLPPGPLPALRAARAGAGRSRRG